MAWECVEGITCSRCGEKGHLQRNCKSVSCHKYVTFRISTHVMETLKYHATTLNFPRELKHIILFQVHIIFFQDMKDVGGDEDIC